MGLGLDSYQDFAKHAQLHKLEYLIHASHLKVLKI